MNAPLNRQGVAVLLGNLLRPDVRPFTTRSVSNWNRRGLPRLKLGGVVTYREEDVRRWVDQHKEGVFL